MQETVKRWTVKRKAEVLRQIQANELTVDQAVVQYGLSRQEIMLWQRAANSAGVHALRTTRIQSYRDLFEDFDRRNQ